jgi:hypothetical protein
VAPPIPNKNQGKTYLIKLNTLGVSGKPTSIEIAPIIKDELCSTVDSLNNVDVC